MNKFLAGRAAEQAAVHYLQSQGYRILGRNVRSKFGEIDVVARDGATLCFIEVKHRSSTRFGWPEESVTGPKRFRLIRLARWYLQKIGSPEVPIRFDVLSLLSGPDGPDGRVRLIRGAFEA